MEFKSLAVAPAPIADDGGRIPDGGMHRFSLQFEDGVLEEEYQAMLRREHLPTIARAFFVVGVFMLAALTFQHTIGGFETHTTTPMFFLVAASLGFLGGLLRWNGSAQLRWQQLVSTVLVVSLVVGYVALDIYAVTEFDRFVDFYRSYGHRMNSSMEIPQGTTIFGDDLQEWFDMSDLPLPAVPLSEIVKYGAAAFNFWTMFTSLWFTILHRRIAHLDFRRSRSATRHFNLLYVCIWTGPWWFMYAGATHALVQVIARLLLITAPAEFVIRGTKHEGPHIGVTVVAARSC
jgi:hypothetical protein